MARGISLFYIWEDNKLVGLKIPSGGSAAAIPSPTETELELVRIFDEHTQLQAENKRLKEESRWIPVIERLPKIEEEVELGFGQTRPVFGKRVDISIHKYTEWENVNGMPITATPTHWKPIILPAQALKGK